MEEEKAAAYYDELRRKGGGAAKFKQGLGFSSSQNDAVPSETSFSSSLSSSCFVRASKLQSIRNKLTSKNPRTSIERSRTSIERSRNADGDGERDSRRRSGSRDEVRKRRRSRSRDDRSKSPRDRGRDRERRRRRRSRSRSASPRDRGRDRERRRRSRSRSASPRERYRDERRRRRSRTRSVSPDTRVRSRGDEKGRRTRKEKSGGDYTKLIHGYDKMSAAERVKAKMKLQLSETAKNDTTNGMGSGWERFNFDKDAPLDDEEVEGADDDKELVKHIGQSFRFSAVEAMREEKVKATHDEAIFGTASVLPGTSSLPPPVDSDSEEDKPESREPAASSLISDQVRTIQQGSWRDRVRKV